MNRIFPEQLNQNLQRHFSRCYFLTGQDPLLLSESQDHICQFAFNQGFDEKTEFHIENSTDWQPIFDACQAYGLFFNKQILLLHLPENLNSTQQTNLLTLCHLLHEDVLLICTLAKLSKSIEKQDWFQQCLAYEPQTNVINCQTPNFEQLPRWISQRCYQLKLQLEQDAVQFLAYSYENNLLALKQNLELLVLLYPEQQVSLQKVQSAVENSAIFTPFQWVDALLAGKIKRAKRILQGLQNEELQSTILLRTLQRDLMLLLELSRPQQYLHLNQKLQQPNLRAEFDRLKIWQNRRLLFAQALQRLTYRDLYLIFQRLADLEREVKQNFNLDIWQALTQLSLFICQPQSLLSAEKAF